MHSSTACRSDSWLWRPWQIVYGLQMGGWGCASLPNAAATVHHKPPLNALPKRFAYAPAGGRRRGVHPGAGLSGGREGWRREKAGGRQVGRLPLRRRVVAIQ